MKIASAAEVRSQFGAYLKASENGPVVVTRNGPFPHLLPAAAVLGDELEPFSTLESGS